MNKIILLIFKFIFSIIFYIQFLVLGPILQLLFFKTKTYYEDNSKQNKRFKGGAVIISNHRSFLDGLVISLKYFLKRFHFISEDFFKKRLKIVKYIAEVAGSIFIDKEENDLGFTEDCKKLFAKNRPVMIFPEGGFKYTYEPAKFYTGYIMLAINTKTKILPVANDFNYGFFKRTHLMIGNSIDLSEYTGKELTWAKRKEINKEISGKFLMLFYGLKKKKADKYKFKYESISPKKGDVIRINTDSCYHYGIYFNDNEVIQFGYGINKTGGDTTDREAIVNSVSLAEFCGEKPPEVRIVKKRHTRKIDDIRKYAESCLGQGRYDTQKNNCLDFVNRVTLKI